MKYGVLRDSRISRVGKPMNEQAVPENTEFIVVNGVSFTHGDIQTVVQNFYSQIQFDAQLKVPFQSVTDWPEHIKRLTHFWWIRFGGRPYLSNQYDPITKHFFAGFNEVLLARWLMLFQTTLQKHLSEQQQNLWGLISERMGHSLSIQNELRKKDHETRQP